LTPYQKQMNYFELYNIPESFHIDKDLLIHRLNEATEQETTEESSAKETKELSLLMQKAFTILADRHKRTGYILSIHDLLNEGAKPQLDSDFLSAVMNLEVQLMQVDDAQKLAEITSQTLELNDELNNQLKHLTADYEQLNDTAKENRLTAIADIYYKQKYLLRIKESLDTFAARF